MPNNITNIVTGKGKINDLIKIFRPDKPFSFSFTVPTPTTPDYEDEWYEWNCENFGTKWDAYEQSDTVIDGEGVKVDFLTAWSPPRAWFIKTAKKFPEVELTMIWYDEDYPTCGKLTSTDGHVSEKYYYDGINAIRFMKEYFPDVYECNMMENVVLEIKDHYSNVISAEYGALFINDPKDIEPILKLANELVDETDYTIRIDVNKLIVEQ